MNLPVKIVGRNFQHMETPIESFVVMVVILSIDLVVTSMNKDLDLREMTYQIIMKNMKKMLIKNLISRDEYMDFESKMKEKYKPIIGPIYSEIDLI